MNYTEIEKLVCEDELNYLTDYNNVNSKLNILEKDLDYRKKYFNKDLKYYNANELNRLRKEFHKELSKIDRLELVNKLLHNININLDNLDNMIDNCEISAKLKKEELKKFKQDLGYLIYFGEISTTDALTRGFSIKEINRMRRICLHEKELAYDSYLNSNDLEKDIIMMKRY